jgi:hypothetical protein
MSFYHKYKVFYFTYLPSALIFSTAVGALAGLSTPMYNISQGQLFVSVIGSTTIGFCAGLLYPISFPLCSWILLRNS